MEEKKREKNRPATPATPIEAPTPASMPTQAETKTPAEDKEVEPKATNGQNGESDINGSAEPKEDAASSEQVSGWKSHISDLELT